MNFDLSEEQRLLKDSLDRALSRTYSFEQRRAHAAGPSGWSRAQWRMYAELGLLGLACDLADGGSGGTAIDTMVAMESMGRHLTLEPYLASVVLGGGLLRRLGSPEVRRRHLGSLSNGEATLAFAHAEDGMPDGFGTVETTATRQAGGWRLQGRKTLVLNGDAADLLLVSARVAAPDGSTRLGVFTVDPALAGVERRGYACQDLRRAAEIGFERVDLPDASLLDGTDDASGVVERVLHEAIAANCAESVGAMERALEMTVDYIKTRQQFGRPIGSFQALQHQAVDMFVATQQARSMTCFATMMAASDDPLLRARAMSASLVVVGRAARFVGERAIQLHGGIGMTYEYAVGHYLKRLTMANHMFGTPETHLGRLAALGGLYEPLARAD